MRATRLRFLPLVWLLIVGLPGVAVAQDPPPAPPAPAEASAAVQLEQAGPDAAQPAPAQESDAPPAPQPSPSTPSVVRIGQGYTLQAGDTVREVVVILGNATIDGRVDRDVVVIFGRAQLSSTTEVGGDLVVVGGGASAAAGTVVRGDLVVIGGGLEAPLSFSPGRESVVIGLGALGGATDVVVPWVTRGLLWGRLIVPDVGWIWIVVAIFFLVYLALNVLFDRPVAACAATLANKPLTAFAVGLVALLLTGPVSFLLTVSVIGLAVVPFVFFALVAAWIVGKVGVMRWFGSSLTRQTAQESQSSTIRSFALGFAVLTVAYMLPVLGLMVWALAGLFGLGAAILAFIAAYRQENPVPTRPPAAPPVARDDIVPDQGPLVSGAPGVPYAGDAFDVPPHVPPVPQGLVSTGPTAARSDLTAFPRAAFLERLAAFVLDVILVVLAIQMLDLGGQGSRVFLLLLAYHVGFWTWKGTSVGGIICQLRVVRVDGARLRFADALVRGLSAIFSIAVLGIGFLWILRDAERQAWHDRIAGTYVVKVPRNWPL